MGLFIAKHALGGVTEYISRKTGKKFRLEPELNGDYTVIADGFVATTQRRAEAIRFIELSDA